MKRITEFGLLAGMTFCAALLITPQEARAVNSTLILTSVSSTGKKTFTIRGGKKCRTLIPGGCSGISMWIDPPVEGIIELDLDFLYNPAEWIFRPDQSGFLCAFSVGGACPPAGASTGTFSVDSLPDDVVPGAGLPGSTVSLVDDNINGIVSLRYRLADPLDSAGEQNFFSFSFDAVREFSAQSRLSFFDDENGQYDFSQSGARCITTTVTGPGACASNQPIVGVNFTRVPEPGSLPLAGLALFALAWLRKRAA